MDNLVYRECKRCEKTFLLNSKNFKTFRKKIGLGYDKTCRCCRNIEVSERQKVRNKENYKPQTKLSSPNYKIDCGDLLSKAWV